MRSVRTRRPAGARATHQTTSSRQREPGHDLDERAERERGDGQQVGGPRAPSANAPATASATSRSLCPLATDWNSTTGFMPNAATANAARAGHTRRTVVAISAIVPRLAQSAVHRNTSTCAWHRVDEPDDDRREPREQRSVDGRRREPLRPHQDRHGVAREVDRRLDVRVRVVDAGDVAVGDVGVDVARDEQRQRDDDHVRADGEDHRGPERDRPAPRLAHHEHERDRRRDHGRDGRRDERRSVKVVEPDTGPRPIGTARRARRPGAARDATATRERRRRAPWPRPRSRSRRSRASTIVRSAPRGPNVSPPSCGTIAPAAGSVFPTCLDAGCSLREKEHLD